MSASAPLPLDPHDVFTAETVELPPRPQAAPSAAAKPPPPVSVVAGSGPDLSDATDTLRQVRLRAAALFLSATFALFLTVGIVLRWRAMEMLVFALVCEISAVIVLTQMPALPRRGLRAIECGIFGVAVLYLAVTQYKLVLYWGSVGDEADLLATVKNTSACTAILVFAYCMLIPNTWQVAARVVLAMWAAPFLAQGLVFWRHPEVLRFAHDVAKLNRVVENVLNSLVTAALAIYGAHVLNTLRREAFEARQLNQYRLRKKLGEGGMGAVYLAEHQFLKRLCALKLMHPESAGDAAATARFAREVQATARLSHPNTIEVYDYGRTADGTFFYVMEYLPGLSLDVLLERHGPLPAGRVIYLLRQACDALVEAHAAGLVHRDIKPANLFAAARGGRFDVVKVLDFGLVKGVAAEPGAATLTSVGRVRGTPLFMSPEQITGVALDGRSDLYALGCVAYDLLTGQPPFAGPSALALMIAHARDPVLPPSKFRPEVPPDLEQVVLRCLEKHPADRCADAAALSRALAGCAAAADWDADRAAAWWAQFEPEATRIPLA